IQIWVKTFFIQYYHGEVVSPAAVPERLKGARLPSQGIPKRLHKSGEEELTSIHFYMLDF
ncbi:MAG: hypothetical protein ABGX42_06715, partial [Gammaproteobacteria bacterium]